MTNMKMSQFAQEKGNSVSLALLKGKPFTVVDVQDSDYKKNGEVKKGKLIITKEKFDLEDDNGNKITGQNEFHTTRTALVHTLSDEKLIAGLKDGNHLGPVKCVKVPSKSGGNPYFILEDA